MAVDRLGNTIAAGQVYALAGTVRHVDGDNVVLTLGNRGEHTLRVNAGDVVKVDDTTAGGAPAAAGYLVDAPHAGLSAERAIADSFSVVWNFTIPGVALCEIAPAYIAALGLLVFQPLASHLTYIAANGVDENMIVNNAVGTSELKNEAVTVAKMKASAPDVLFGRGSGGAGEGEEFPCTPHTRTFFELEPDAGDIAYFDGSIWKRLGIGTVGQVLTVSSDGIPEWATPAP